MRWPTISLETFVDINPRVKVPRGQPCEFVEMADITPGRRYVARSSIRVAGGSGSKFLDGDTLMARITPCLENGKIAQFKSESEAPALGSTEFWVFRAKPRVSDPSFVFYLVASDIIRGPAEKSMVGASGRQRADIESIRELQVPMPPIHEQRRIASILSAYDDLIENNTRRIAILEEMARRIYEEWFVRFRFPGHERARIVESEFGMTPEGWTVRTLQSVCLPKRGIQTGPFGSQLHKADYADEGIPVPMPKDLAGLRVATDSIARVPPQIADGLARHRLQPGDILYGRRGDIGRRAFVMAHQSGWVCGTGCLRIRPEPTTVDGWYLFNLLGQDSVASQIAGRAHGATMPNLNAKLMESVRLLCAPRLVQDQFTAITFPMAELREILHMQNETLSATRDLLLPKLISGELEVSDVPEPEALAA